MDRHKESELVPCSWFADWREPKTFFLTARKCGFQFEADVFLGRPDLQYLQEAYIAGLFAVIWNDHKPCQVRLISESFPDAEIRDDENSLTLEIVLADKNGRAMAKEHRDLREKRERILPAESPQAKAEYAREAIPRVCAQKVRRYLGASDSISVINAGLLIAPNFSTLLDDPLISDDEMAHLTEPWSKNFNSIWVLLGARISRLWPSPLVMAAVRDPWAE